MNCKLAQRNFSTMVLLVLTMTCGCSGRQGRNSGGRGTINVIHIDSFLGISRDFKFCAVLDINGVEGVDLETGKLLTSPSEKKGGFGFFNSYGVKIIDLDTGNAIGSPKWDPNWGSARSVTFGKDVFAVETSGSVKIFSLATGEQEQNVHAESIGHVAFTDDGRFLVMTWFRSGHYLTLRDIQRKKTVADIHLDAFTSFISLAVGKERVATYESEFQSKSATISVFETETGKTMTKLRCGIGGENPLAISPGGNLIAYGAGDDVVLVDIEGGKVTHKLEGHLDFVRAVAFSPNADILGSSADDKTIRFWNVKNGTETHIIKNVPARVRDLIFSADGKRIAIVCPGTTEILSVDLN